MRLIPINYECWNAVKKRLPAPVLSHHAAAAADDNDENDADDNDDDDDDDGARGARTLRGAVPGEVP